MEIRDWWGRPERWGPGEGRAGTWDGGGSREAGATTPRAPTLAAPGSGETTG